MIWEEKMSVSAFSVLGESINAPQIRPNRYLGKSQLHGPPGQLSPAHQPSIWPDDSLGHKLNRSTLSGNPYKKEKEQKQKNIHIKSAAALSSPLTFSFKKLDSYFLNYNFSIILLNVTSTVNHDLHTKRLQLICYDCKWDCNNTQNTFFI